MKNPLHYQVSEYDCGPTSMLNAMSYLFSREEIPAEIIRETMLYCMDCHGTDGLCGTKGTSCTAMMFLSNWLNSFGMNGQMPISCTYHRGPEVKIDEDSIVVKALRSGGAVVARLYLDEWHYVLLTGFSHDRVLLFDPYYQEEPYEQKDILLIPDHPFSYNRIVPAKYFNQETLSLYSLGPSENREAVILYNKNTADLFGLKKTGWQESRPAPSRAESRDTSIPGNAAAGRR